MNHTSCAEFLEFFGYFHGCVGSENDDCLNFVFSHLDASPLSKIQAFKDLGNDLFRQNQFAEASACYDKACRLLSDVLKDVSGLDLNTFSSLAISLCLNLAACAIKFRAFEGALILCSMVLNFYPRHAKALFRKAVALRNLHRLPEARCTLEEAVSVEPRNKDILHELDEVKKLHVFNLNGKRVVDDSFEANDIREGKRAMSSLIGHDGHDASGSNNVTITENCEQETGCATTSSTMVIKDLGSTSSYQFDPLSKGKKGKISNHDAAMDTVRVPFEKGNQVARSSTELLNADISDTQNESTKFSDLNTNSATISETHLSSPVKGDCNPFDTCTLGSTTKYSFSNKKQAHKNLFLSSNDYANLMLGKKLQFFHPASGASLIVRPLFSKNSTSTGTPHESFSCEAAVPISSPPPVNLCTSMDISQVGQLNIINFTNEEDQPLEVKRPCLSTERIFDPITEVREVSVVKSTLLEQSGMDGSDHLSSRRPFVFSALKTHSSKRCSRHCMGRDRAKLKNLPLVKVGLGSSTVFSRFTSLDMVVSSKRKEICPIQFDAFYHSPRKRRRLCIFNESVCFTSCVTWVSSSLGVSNAPRFAM